MNQVNKKYLLILSFIAGGIALIFSCVFVLRIILFFLLKIHSENNQYFLDLFMMTFFSLIGLALNNKWTKYNKKRFVSSLSYVICILGIIPALIFILIILLLLICTPFLTLIKL